MTMDQPTIQVGATVKVANQHRASLTTITRETKTQWVTADDRKFSKRTGRLVGERYEWTFTTVEAVTAAEVVAFRAERARVKSANYLKDVEWGTLDVDTLSAVVAIVKGASKGGDQ